MDDLVKMKVFVPQGVTCFSGATFDCTSSFENWQMVLREEGRRIYPGRNPDTMIFHRVHKAIEEVCPIFEPAVKHFILADTEEQEHTRTVVFAIFTSRFDFFWSLSLDPDYPGVGYTGLVWRRERLGHLSQQSKAPRPESVGSPRRLLCLL